MLIVWLIGTLVILIIGIIGTVLAATNAQWGDGSEEFAAGVVGTLGVFIIWSVISMGIHGATKQSEEKEAVTDTTKVEVVDTSSKINNTTLSPIEEFEEKFTWQEID